MEEDGENRVDKYGATAANFLFGNIDDKGRLEGADYLDHEAREQLSNVAASTIAEDNNELHTVASTIVSKNRVQEEKEDYDEEEDDAVAHDADAVDYADENDVDLEDEFAASDQTRLASIALGSKPKPAGDDDENYDDDEEADGKDFSLDKNRGKDQAAQLISDQKKEQLLGPDLRQAEEDFEGSIAKIDPDAILKFTSIFLLPPAKVPYSPHRQKFGVYTGLSGDTNMENVESQLQSDDDEEELNALPESPEVDFIEVFLQSDAESDDSRENHDVAESPGDVIMDDQDNAKSLKSVPVQIANVEQFCTETDSLLVQDSWEGRIQWSDETDDTSDEKMPAAEAGDSGNEKGEWEEDDWIESAVDPGRDDMKKDIDSASKPEVAALDAREPVEQMEIDDNDDMEEVKIDDKDDMEEVKIDDKDDMEEVKIDDKDDMEEVKIDEDSEKGKDPVAAPDAASEDKVAGAKEARKDKAEAEAETEAEAAKGGGGESAQKIDAEEEISLTNLKGDGSGIAAVNNELEEDQWMGAIRWDSASDEEKTMADAVKRLSKLWLSVNDPNLILEPASPSNDDDPNSLVQAKDKNGLVGKPSENAHDPFNISNDKYYFYGGTVRGRRVDRQSVLRGLNHAPPCVKARTSDFVPSDAYLINFHKPQFTPFRLNHTEKLIPMRRKRPKGGILQIAGQVPKKRSDLSCACKDAFRVFLFEHSLERMPATIPIMGMASRIITYARRKSRNLGETPQLPDSSLGPTGQAADIVHLAKDEPPPLYAGDLPPDGTPVSVLESSLHAAPCKTFSPPTTDFLVVVKDNQYYVREVDEVISLGATEPRLEVMAPNTDRFKRYAHDRVLLWILREFDRKKRKGIEPVGLKRTDLANAFTRRRTYPQTSLPKILKEVSIFEGGTYMMSEPVKGFAALEAEKLRTINPEETCAFEAMEAGWEALIRLGIRIFTHPTSQGNILAVSEKTGLSMGRPVAEFIRQQLLHTPWYRSSQMIDAQKSFRTQLNSALTRARAANDISEGGSAAESRLAQMSSEDCFNLLTSFYKVPQKKIPSDLDGRRDLLRVQPIKRGKGSTPEKVDFPAIVQEVIAKHRAIYSKASASAAAAAGGDRGGSSSGGGQSESGGLKVIPLEAQLKALNGDFHDIPAEDEKTGAAFYAKTAFSAKAMVTNHSANGVIKKSHSHDKSNPEKKKDGTKKSSEHKSREDKDKTDHGKESQPQKSSSTKKITKLKVTRKVKNALGEEVKEVRYVTDAAEIERLKGQQAAKAKKQKAAKASEAAEAKTAGGAEEGKKSLKISIDVHKISQASKARNSVKGSTGEGDPAQKRIGKILIDRKVIEEANARRIKRTQYGEDADYGRGRKQPRKRSDNTRRPQNGMFMLNEILAKVEKGVRSAQGYIAETVPALVIKRVKSGEEAPEGAKNLAAPKDTGLDFTVPVKNVPMYGQVVKEQMYLNLIRIRCTAAPYHYKTAEMFLSDMRLLVENARKFNTTEETQWVIQHAELLLQVAEDKIEEFRADLDKAEELVRTEESNPTSKPDKGSGSGIDASPTEMKTPAEEPTDRGSPDAVMLE